MNAKKSHRIRVLDRSKSAEGIAQRREYKRNCRKISNAIDEMVEKYWGDDLRQSEADTVTAMTQGFKATAAAQADSMNGFAAAIANFEDA